MLSDTFMNYVAQFAQILVFSAIAVFVAEGLITTLEYMIRKRK